MIQYDFDTDKLNQLASVFQDPRQLVSAVVEQATADSANSALSAVQSYPRPSVHPFRWSYDPAKQDRARRWYFAAIKRGEISTDGTRYKRTNKFKQSWDVGVQESASSIDAVLGSDFEKASYVVGDDTGNIGQVPGHDRTGWYDFQQPAEQFQDDIIREVEKALPDVIERKVK